MDSQPVETLSESLSRFLDRANYCLELCYKEMHGGDWSRLQQAQELAAMANTEESELRAFVDSQMESQKALQFDYLLHESITLWIIMGRIAKRRKLSSPPPAPLNASSTPDVDALTDAFQTAVYWAKERQQESLAPLPPVKTAMDEFKELSASIELKNKRVLWRGLPMYATETYLLIIRALCEARLQGFERRTMAKLIKINPLLEGKKVATALKANIDQRLIELVEHPPKENTAFGYRLRLPSEVLVPAIT